MKHLISIMKPALLALVFFIGGVVFAQPLPEEERIIGASGLTLPRFVSISADEANMRSGPGEQYPINWVYNRKLYPLVVVGEYEQWRQVREIDGTEGWIHRILLSNKRTALVARKNATLMQEPSAIAPQIVRLDVGVIGEILECIPTWCRLDIDGTTGWVPTSNLWGVFEEEIIN